MNIKRIKKPEITDKAYQTTLIANLGNECILEVDLYHNGDEENGFFDHFNLEISSQSGAGFGLQVNQSVLTLLKACNAINDELNKIKAEPPLFKTLPKS